MVRKMIEVKLTSSELVQMMKMIDTKIGWMERNKEKFRIRESTLNGWRELFNVLDEARSFEASFDEMKWNAGQK